MSFYLNIKKNVAQALISKFGKPLEVRQPVNFGETEWEPDLWFRRYSCKGVETTSTSSNSGNTTRTTEYDREYYIAGPYTAIVTSLVWEGTTTANSITTVGGEFFSDAGIVPGDVLFLTIGDNDFGPFRVVSIDPIKAGEESVVFATTTLPVNETATQGTASTSDLSTGTHDIYPAEGWKIVDWDKTTEITDVESVRPGPTTVLTIARGRIV